MYSLVVGQGQSNKRNEKLGRKVVFPETQQLFKYQKMLRTQSVTRKKKKKKTVPYFCTA